MRECCSLKLTKNKKKKKGMGIPNMTVRYYPHEGDEGLFRGTQTDKVYWETQVTEETRKSLEFVTEGWYLSDEDEIGNFKEAAKRKKAPKIVLMDKVFFEENFKKTFFGAETFEEYAKDLITNNGLNEMAPRQIKIKKTLRKRLTGWSWRSKARFKPDVPAIPPSSAARIVAEKERAANLTDWVGADLPPESGPEEDYDQKVPVAAVPARQSVTHNKPKPKTPDLILLACVRALVNKLDTVPDWVRENPESYKPYVDLLDDNCLNWLKYTNPGVGGRKQCFYLNTKTQKGQPNPP